MSVGNSNSMLNMNRAFPAWSSSRMVHSDGPLFSTSPIAIKKRSAPYGGAGGGRGGDGGGGEGGVRGGEGGEGGAGGGNGLLMLSESALYSDWRSWRRKVPVAPPARLQILWYPGARYRRSHVMLLAHG